MRTHHALALLASAGLLALTGCGPVTSAPEPEDKPVTTAVSYTHL